MMDFNQTLERYLPHSSDTLHQAMRYSVLGPGKRLRPALVYAAGKLGNAPLTHLDRAACAVEYIHAYSLIHDDLPSMDNDDYRRGKLSCHKVFGEAVAILAGDALQSLAFELLAQTKNSALIKQLAKSIGARGMVLGQSLDIQAKTSANKKIIFLNKTAKLIIASLQLGYLCNTPYSRVIFKKLNYFGQYLGLAFQYQDDFLDGMSDIPPASYEIYYKKALLILDDLDNPAVKDLKNIINVLFARTE